MSTSINNLGEIAFLWKVTGGAADHGIFLRSGGTTVPLVLSGQFVPGTGTLTRLGQNRLNDSGQLVFGSAIDGGHIFDQTIFLLDTADCVGP